jgi:hypothetical protein
MVASRINGKTNKFYLNESYMEMKWKKTKVSIGKVSNLMFKLSNFLFNSFFFSFKSRKTLLRSTLTTCWMFRSIFSYLFSILDRNRFVNSFEIWIFSYMTTSPTCFFGMFFFTKCIITWPKEIYALKKESRFLQTYATEPASASVRDSALQRWEIIITINSNFSITE